MDWNVVGTLWLTLIIVLIDCSMDAFTPQPSDTLQRRTKEKAQHLVPSQVIRSSNQAGLTYQRPAPNRRNDGASLVLSVITTTQSTDATAAGTGTGTAQSEGGVLKRSRRRKRPTKKKAAATAKSNNSSNTTFPLAGNQPDIYWRAVSMEHLRQHPRFKPLPEAHRIAQLNNLEDVRLFRQESWQWDTLHCGRCTTSQAVAALGFLEPSVGEVLGVPSSWRRGGVGAFVRLRQKSLRSLDEMNKILCVDGTLAAVVSESSSSTASLDERPVWSEPSDGNATQNNATYFSAAYDYELSKEQVKDRKTHAQRFSHSDDLSKSIRMMWGNTQEATSLLTALNFFSKDDPDFFLEEVGMCGAGLDLNTTRQSSSLLIGATPDGILRHSDGRVEALEVKNHCPFYGNRSELGKTKSKGGQMKRFNVGSKPVGDGVFSHYIPQLQMEMLCLGPDCKSAVMVRQTATVGALLLRMYRDDEWIEEMLYWLHRFHLDYVQKDEPPPHNFFWNAADSEDRARYRKFVYKTKEIRNSKVEIIGRIQNHEVQRMGEDAPLFLD